MEAELHVIHHGEHAVRRRHGLPRGQAVHVVVFKAFLHVGSVVLSGG